jgi:hypothetical protein
MARPGDEIGAGTEGRGHLRASHADRERVVGVLKAAFVDGRLAKDEFDLRVGQTFAARTYAELAALTADLPAAKPPQSARAQGRRPVMRPGRVITAASALYAGAWAALLLSPHIGGYPMTSPLMLDGTFLYVGILIICVAAILVNRRDGRSGQQPPPRPGADGTTSRYLPPTVQDGQLPPAGPGHRHGAEAVRWHLPRPPSPARGRGAGGAIAAGTAPASG